MSKYFCPYCSNIINCMHDLRYLAEDLDSELELESEIESEIESEESKSEFESKSESEESSMVVDITQRNPKRKNIEIEIEIENITYKFKKIKVNKKISFKRKVDEICNTNSNKKNKI